ncbi:hypothetical protein BJY04DRAFT_141990 [Aspergillus karnatakaensis]|uniref:uncharacterized protein n=1 Tax=Aspergillus karnatakaensis TaxID=1810916 RepID=UPI003CCD57D3
MLNRTATLLARSLRQKSALVATRPGTGTGIGLGVGLGPCRRFLATVESPLHEFFVVIFNKKGVKEADLAPARETIKFKEQDVILTFAGDMMADADAGSPRAGTLGACFAVQAASEGSVLQAIRAHENTAKGLWDIETVEISALETIHTGDYERVRE